MILSSGSLTLCREPGRFERGNTRFVCGNEAVGAENILNR
jgi:hypothetical protein